jgi:hypothetical protein
VADPTGVEYASSIHHVTLSASGAGEEFRPTSPCRRRHVPMLQRPSIPAVRIPCRQRSTRRSDAGHAAVRACVCSPVPMGFRTRRSDASCTSHRPHRAHRVLSQRTAKGQREEESPSCRRAPVRRQFVSGVLSWTPGDVQEHRRSGCATGLEYSLRRHLCRAGTTQSTGRPAHDCPPAFWRALCCDLLQLCCACASTETQAQADSTRTPTHMRDSAAVQCTYLRKRGQWRWRSAPLWRRQH